MNKKLLAIFMMLALILMPISVHAETGVPVNCVDYISSYDPQLIVSSTIQSGYYVWTTAYTYTVPSDDLTIVAISIPVYNHNNNVSSNSIDVKVLIDNVAVNITYSIDNSSASPYMLSVTSFAGKTLTIQHRCAEYNEPKGGVIIASGGSVTLKGMTASEAQCKQLNHQQMKQRVLPIQLCQEHKQQLIKQLTQVLRQEAGHIKVLIN